jgi:large subunit ribosomal protein L23
MPELYKIIERPVITEKSLTASGENKYAFIVHPDANKIQIRDAVQKLFTTAEGGAVTVTAVNTMNVKGKTKRYRTFGKFSVGKTPTVKKAIVTLAEGQAITIFEGV